MKLKIKHSAWEIILVLFIWGGLIKLGLAEEMAKDYFASKEVHKIQLIQGKNEVLKFAQDVSQTFSDDWEIVTLDLVNPREILVNAKAAGKTKFSVWNKKNQKADFEVVVMIDYFASEEPHKIQLVAGKSQVLQFIEDVARTSVNNQDIAAIVLIDPREILVNAKAPGVTSLIVWNESGKRAVFDVVVDLDTSRLADLINKVVADEKIKVDATNNKVVLSGQVEKSTSVTKAGSIATAYLPDAVNLLSVKQTKQVLLQVRFAEVDRTAVKNLGTDFIFDKSGAHDFALHSYGGSVATPALSLATLPSTTDLFLRFWVGEQLDVSSLVQALEQRGLLRIIAEPNLVAVDGQKASFLAGGEVPIPVVTSQDTSVQWKEYGVRLSFMPTITDSEAIRLQLEPEVSSLDAAHGTTVGGLTVPALITRKTQTVVELKDGESLIIGGLIHQETNRTSSKTPFLGDIPLLGKLFSSERYQKGETELLVLVTPTLVTPRNINACGALKLSPELAPILEAPQAPYDEHQAGQVKRLLKGEELQDFGPEKGVSDEESLFMHQPRKNVFEDIANLELDREEGERVFSEREKKIYKQLPAQYKIMKEDYFGAGK